MTLHGWDASDFDADRGPMDLGAAARDGIRFFTHKAWEGSGIPHRNYGPAMVRARDAGIPFLGPYFVVRTPGNNGHGSVAQQVSRFLDYVRQQTPWILDHPGSFGQVDTEHWGYDDVDPRYGAEACDLIQAATGWVAIHYAPRWAYGDSIPGNHPLWASSYGTNPAVPYRNGYPGDDSSGWARYSGRVPAILQYGSRLVIGSQPTCDASAFRGTEQDFARMIMGSNPKAGEDTVITFVRGLGDPTVWRAEGGMRTAIPSEQHLADIRYQSGQGAIAPLANGGRVMEVGNLDAFGVAYPPAIGGTQQAVGVSDAQLADLEAKLAVKLPTAADIVSEMLSRIPAA